MEAGRRLDEYGKAVFAHRGAGAVRTVGAVRT
jgi:hypothetical protein